MSVSFRAKPVYRTANYQLARISGWDISRKRQFAVVEEGGAPHSSSVGALIRWLLANGYTMAQIRAMHPAWFSNNCGR
jgi:hypothetical protein